MPLGSERYKFRRQHRKKTASEIQSNSSYTIVWQGKRKCLVEISRNNVWWNVKCIMHDKAIATGLMW